MLVFKEKKNVSNMGDIYLKRNDMSTTFLQQILSGRLLLLGQKSNLSVSFKIEPITTNHL